MITNIIISLTSLVTGTTMLFGGMTYNMLVRVQSLPSRHTQEAETSAPIPVPQRIKDQLKRGDDLVHHGLVMATVSITGLSPVEVMQALDEGSSLVKVAESAGYPVAAVLSIYDETVEYIFHRAIENERLPANTAEYWIRWYQNVGRKMVEQPGMQPRYPGLHQLHVGLIAAVARVGDIKRWEMQSELHACRSLDELLSNRGHSSQEAIDLVMQRISSLLDKSVELGMLADGQRQDWQASLQDALQEMVVMPGMHLAGMECTP